MKKIVISCVLTLVFLLSGVNDPYAQEAMTVSGNDYTVFILCRGDSGDYCRRNNFQQDMFQFRSDGTFEISSLEEEKEITDISEGTYNSTTFGFTGSYEISMDFLFKKYEFSFSGFSIYDVIILGQFIVTYFELTGIPPDYEQQEEAQGYFVGIRN